MQNINGVSKKRAIGLFGSQDLSSFEVGTINGLQQIHEYLLVVYTTLQEKSAH